MHKPTKAQMHNRVLFYAALRSGLYAQAMGCLRRHIDDDGLDNAVGMCCQGVGLDITKIGAWIRTETVAPKYAYKTYLADGINSPVDTWNEGEGPDQPLLVAALYGIPLHHEDKQQLFGPIDGGHYFVDTPEGYFWRNMTRYNDNLGWSFATIAGELFRSCILPYPELITSEQVIMFSKSGALSDPYLQTENPTRTQGATWCAEWLAHNEIAITPTVSAMLENVPANFTDDMQPISL